jgi:hypothetical protein
MSTPLEIRERRARQYLITLAVMASIGAVTATGLYSYPETLAAIERPMVWLHDISGDIAILVTGLYLFNHLQRTWRMKKAKLSRYSGIFVVGIWCVGGATGIYGQFAPLVESSWPWRLHFVTCLASIIIVCFHGAWAYRPRKRAS